MRPPLVLRVLYRRWPRDDQGHVHHLVQVRTTSEPVPPETVDENGEVLDWPDEMVGQLTYVLVPRRLWLRGIEVHPDFRRRGIATAMLANVLARHPRRRPVHDGLSEGGERWWATFGAPDEDWLE